MLDREVVREFLDEELKGIETPKGLSKEALSEAFCQYVEDDYYEVLKDNIKSFFNHGSPDWTWIAEKAKLASKADAYQEEKPMHMALPLSGMTHPRYHMILLPKDRGLLLSPHLNSQIVRGPIQSI
jgi:hypothetical protein